MPRGERTWPQLGARRLQAYSGGSACRTHRQQECSCFSRATELPMGYMMTRTLGNPIHDRPAFSHLLLLKLPARTAPGIGLARISVEFELIFKELLSWPELNGFGNVLRDVWKAHFRSIILHLARCASNYFSEDINSPSIAQENDPRHSGRITFCHNHVLKVFSFECCIPSLLNC